MCWMRKWSPSAVFIELFKRETRNPPTLGQWVFVKGDGKTCADGWQCTACGVEYHTNVPYFEEFQYCPNCGTKMMRAW